MIKIIACFSALVSVLIQTSPLIAQDTLNTVCDCYRPDYHAPIGVMIDHTHDKGAWMISYRYMNMNMRDYLQGDAKINKEKIYENYLMSSTSMIMQMHMLMVMYGLSDKITLMGMANYTTNQMNMSMVMYGNHVHGNPNMSGSMEMNEIIYTSGFSDAKLYLLYSLMNRRKHQLVLSAGASLPFGSISSYGNNMMGVRQKDTYSMQLGSGSWGILPGITYTGQGVLYSWGIQMTGDVKVNRNKFGYKLGNEFMSNVWIARKWNSWLSNSLRVNSNLTGKITGFDPEISSFRTTDPDADKNNFGGFNSSINAGINIALTEGFFSGHRFGFEYGIPFYQYVNGMQMKKQGILYAGWQYLF
jgi:hypothetical protein